MMAESTDTPQKYGLWDSKEQSWVRNKEYQSLKRASQGADHLDNKYGASRYVPKMLGGGKAAPVSAEGGMKPGQSPSLDNPIQQAKGGLTASRRADGIASRGKTKGRFV
jgi:hypothetical protein